MDTWIVQAKKIMRDRGITQKDIASAMGKINSWSSRALFYWAISTHTQSVKIFSKILRYQSC